MQILHPFAGSVQQYIEQLANPDCYRPDHCPQCHTKHPLTAHGFYTRTLTEPAAASDFVHRALTMLESTGWIAAHRFLFARVRCHLLGWPRSLAPDGRRAAVSPAAAPA